MVIKVLNLDKLIKSFGDISNVDVMPAIINGSVKVQGTAKKLAPVSDTLRTADGTVYHVGGTLRGSIHRKTYRDQLSAIVYTVLEYAPYVEFGTKYMTAQPFLRPAMNINRLAITQEIKRLLKGEISQPGSSSKRRTSTVDSYKVSAGGKVTKITTFKKGKLKKKK